MPPPKKFLGFIPETTAPPCHPRRKACFSLQLTEYLSQQGIRQRGSTLNFITISLIQNEDMRKTPAFIHEALLVQTRKQPFLMCSLVQNKAYGHEEECKADDISRYLADSTDSEVPLLRSPPAGRVHPLAPSNGCTAPPPPPTSSLNFLNIVYMSTQTPQNSCRHAIPVAHYKQRPNPKSAMLGNTAETMLSVPCTRRGAGEQNPPAVI